MELFSFGFLACLVSGFLCFWLFWKCVDWFEKIYFLKSRYYVHSVICCQCSDVRLFDVCARQAGKVLKNIFLI